MHPTDAAARGITEGAMIMLHNLRGAVLAAVTLSENIMPGVVQLPTGALVRSGGPAGCASTVSSW